MMLEHHTSQVEVRLENSYDLVRQTLQNIDRLSWNGKQSSPPTKVHAQCTRIVKFLRKCEGTLMISVKRRDSRGCMLPWLPHSICFAHGQVLANGGIGGSTKVSSTLDS